MGLKSTVFASDCGQPASRTGRPLSHRRDDLTNEADCAVVQITRERWNRALEPGDVSRGRVLHPARDRRARARSQATPRRSCAGSTSSGFSRRRRDGAMRCRAFSSRRFEAWREMPGVWPPQRWSPGGTSSLWGPRRRHLGEDYLPGSPAAGDSGQAGSRGGGPHSARVNRPSIAYRSRHLGARLILWPTHRSPTRTCITVHPSSASAGMDRPTPRRGPAYRTRYVSVGNSARTGLRGSR